MGGAKLVTMLLLLTWLVPVPIYVACADVSPGDVIDKTNWQKAEGLLPDVVLDLVKQGKIKINVGKLGFTPEDYLRDHIRETLKSNVGKYYVDDEGVLRDTATKQTPMTYVGIPFPVVDPKDPKAGYYPQYNMHWNRMSCDSPKFKQRMGWVGKGGLEKTVENSVLAGAWASPPWKDVPNPEKFEMTMINMITAPYDVAGTAMMMWQRAGGREDDNYAYVPAIRRCRRMSPTGRSDSMFGSDFTADDIAVDNMPTEDGTWKFIGTKEMLVPFLSPDKPVNLIKQADGSFKVDTTSFAGAKFGFDVKGWDGAPWAVTNWTWVKRMVHVCEVVPKDKYYNASKSQLFYDAKTTIIAAKIVWDRGGKQWRVLMGGAYALSTPDKSWSIMDGNAGMFAYDMLADHASVNWGIHETTEAMYSFPFAPSDFSLAGFVKFCK